MNQKFGEAYFRFLIIFAVWTAIAFINEWNSLDVIIEDLGWILIGSASILWVIGYILALRGTTGKEK